MVEEADLVEVVQRHLLPRSCHARQPCCPALFSGAWRSRLLVHAAAAAVLLVITCGERSWSVMSFCARQGIVVEVDEAHRSDRR